MRGLADLIDRVNRRIGRSVIWLVLLIVILQFFVVIFRYVFGLNSVDAQELIIITHGLIFMLAAGYVLQGDYHVRVDIFYERFSARTKAAINLGGSILLLMPMVLVIWIFSWPYVDQSWGIFEAAPDSEFLRARYLQKTAILVFAALLGIQGLSIFFRGLLAVSGDKAALGEFSKPDENINRHSGH